MTWKHISFSPSVRAGLPKECVGFFSRLLHGLFEAIS